MSSAVEDTLRIHDLICLFQQAFDTADWGLMRRCLGDRVFTDYSSFRGTPPETLSADEYVARRKSALSDLRMLHCFSNLRVELDGSRARARCNYVIHRFHPDFRGESDGFFHSYGHYLFEFERSADGWKIVAITQNLLMNHGNPQLHGATRSQT